MNISRLFSFLNFRWIGNISFETWLKWFLIDYTDRFCRYYPIFDEIFITVHRDYILLLHVVDNPLENSFDLNKNDVVDVTSTLLSRGVKWCHWIPNAKFPPITTMLNRPTYHKSAKALSPNFMGTPNRWISWL